MAGGRSAARAQTRRPGPPRAPGWRPPHGERALNLLGFDTSTAATAVCVLRADGEAFEAIPDPEALLRSPGHAGELLPAIAETMERSGLGWEDLDAVAVGTGPGGFTGLRIGVTTARSLAHARGLELRPVSSLAALAQGIDAELALPLIDAKRGELFGALYHRETERWPAFSATPEDLAERLRGEGLTPLVAGDGSIRFRGVLETAGARVAPDGSAAHVVHGLHVCRLALTAAPAPPEAVLPDYMRLPDAKPAQ